VDDEPKILEGMKRMLHRYRQEWGMTFASGGQEALELMQNAPFDVVVSDMRMPGMDGATLLGRVKARYPHTVRIVLSGHAELEATLRVVPIAHQFLCKPCEPGRLREIITRACNLHALMADATLQKTVGAIDTLPALPGVYTELVAVMAAPEACLDDVTAIVARDAGITAKILQLVNSSFFGVARSIDSLRDATSYLGLNMIRDLTLSMEVFRAFDGTRRPPGFSIEERQAHATLTGRIARKLLSDKSLAESAFLAAMLHDVGALILATASPEDYERSLSAATQRGQPVHTLEKELSGVSHAEVGAYLLDLWGLPYPIVEAVANHHHPSRVNHETFDVLGAVHVSDALSHELSASPSSTPPELDLDYLDALGVLQRLPEWREIAAAEAGACEDKAA
jgi:HD-like signal output (HDOD) protein/CheY-like chemotaxis protein